MIRELRVGYQTGFADSDNLPYRPMIRLAGIWLLEAGFEVGDEIIVIVENGRLTVEKIS